MNHTEYFCADNSHLMDRDDPYCYHCAHDILTDRVQHLESYLHRLSGGYMSLSRPSIGRIVREALSDK